MKAILALLLATSVGFAADSAPFFKSGFESSDTLGSGQPLRGWSASAGVRIVDEVAATGTRSVLIPASQESGLLARHFAIANEHEVFVDFHLRPAVTALPESSTFVELGVSGIGFRQTAAGLEALAFDGDGKEGGRWIVTQLGQSGANWIHVTLRLDYVGGTWDLYLDGKLVRQSLGFFGAPERSVYVGVFGGQAADTWFDDLYVGSQPPWGVEIKSGEQKPSQSDPDSVKRAEERDENDRAKIAERKTLRGSGTPSLTQAAPAVLAKQREQKLNVKLQVWSILD